MGWNHDISPGCEGYVLGLVRDGDASDSYRELRYPGDDRPVLHVHALQGACTCGWRSPRFVAPAHAQYVPFTITNLEARIEEALRSMWRAHLTAHIPSELQRSQL